MKNLRGKLILGGAVLLLLVLGYFGLRILKPSDQDAGDTQNSQQKIESVNLLPVKERPFATIVPRSDGKEITIEVNRLNEAKEVEYELEYQAGTLLQGAFGKIDFTKELPPVSRNILLGSCSAGGKCSYHENVNGGSLLLRYKDGETTALKGEWNFQKMSQEEGRFSSRDAKFTFDTGETGLGGSTVVVVAQTMGLPGPVDGEVIAGPFGVFLPKGVTLRSTDVNLEMRLSKEEGNAKLLGWTQNGWKEYASHVSGKSLSAIVDAATTFVAVSLPDQT